MKLRFFLFFFHFIIFLFNTLHSIAQGTIITDNPFYVSFDVIHYTIITGKSGLKYYASELIDASGKSWFQQKLKSEDNRFSGEFSSLINIPTGFYWIKVYPAGSELTGDNVWYKPVIIVNTNDLDNDIWKTAILKVTGKISLHIEKMADNNIISAGSLKILLLDEAKKILNGPVELKDSGFKMEYLLDNDAEGFYTLPAEIMKTDKFQLRLKTGGVDSLVFSGSIENQASKDVIVINHNNKNTSTHLFNVNTPQKNYAPRSTVSVNITRSGESFQMDSSIVIKANAINLDNVTFANGPTILIDEGNENIIPKLITQSSFAGDKILMEGNYKDPLTGNPKADHTVALIALGRCPRISFAKVDNSGNFEFDVSDLIEDNTYYVSTIDRTFSGISLRDNYFKRYNQSPVIYFNESDFSTLESFIAVAKTRKILFTQYYERQLPNAIESDQLLYDTTCIYAKPDISYKMSDYIQFNDMKDVIRNILINVHLIEKKNKRELFIYNNQLPGLNRHPLFLINGIPTFDPEFILGLDINRIKKIDILDTRNSLRPFGITGFGGVMAIYTDEKIYIPNYMKIGFKGFHEQESEYFPVLEDEYPDLSPVVYWNAKFPFTHGAAVVTFSLNDLLTDIILTVTGIDNEGRIIEDSTIIKIK